MSRSVHLTTAFAAIVAFCYINSVSVVGIELNKPLINVEVYYESLCADSIYFITRELAPVYKDLKDFLNVKLVPFGKASWVVGENNQPEFTCQHGPNECRGNRAQACALYEIEQTVNAEDRQQRAVDVVACVMSSNDPASAVPQCVEKLGFEAESRNRIATCSGCKMGNELLIANGEKTKAFETPLMFVPTIVINGEKNSAAYKDFKSVICGKIPVGQKPAICELSS